jgi:hypothetical protein
LAGTLVPANFFWEKPVRLLPCWEIRRANPAFSIACKSEWIEAKLDIPFSRWTGSMRDTPLRPTR